MLVLTGEVLHLPEHSRYGVMRLSWAAYYKLLEYTSSIPTGVIPRKTWRRSVRNSVLDHLVGMYGEAYEHKGREVCPFYWFVPVAGPKGLDVQELEDGLFKVTLGGKVAVTRLQHLSAAVRQLRSTS